MKTISVRHLQRKVRESVDASQRERIVVTRHGRPAAVLFGVEGYDWEQLTLQMNPAFWRMIERRRRQNTTPMAEVRKRLEARRPARQRRTP